MRTWLERTASLLIVGTALSFASAAYAGGPDRLVREKEAAIHNLLLTEEVGSEAIVAVFDELIDYEELSAIAVGSSKWRSLDKAQRSELTGLVGHLTEQYLEHTFRDLGAYRFVQGGSRGTGKGTWVVRTVATPLADANAEPLTLDFHVAHRGHCVFEVNDVAVDGVSLVETYRSEFARVMRSEGWDALLDKLRKKAREDVARFSGGPTNGPSYSVLRMSL